jgi:hypothetical protein
MEQHEFEMPLIVEQHIMQLPEARRPYRSEWPDRSRHCS